MFKQDIWFHSDPHFGHKNIIKYENRPFKDTNEMDEHIIQKWNSVVKDNDLVFLLGDIFFCKAERQQYVVNRLKGRVHVIRGNHDYGVSNGKFKNTFGWDIHNYYFFENFLLSHKPEPLINLQTIKELGIHGNIHGHVHSQIDGLDQDFYKCVSVECIDYMPIHFEEIKKHFKL